MKQVNAIISMHDLDQLASQRFGNLVKAVVDVEKRILVIDAELHSDLEHFLLEQGSQQSSLWGINLRPQLFGADNFIEYDSMINLRPNQNNQTRGVDDPSLRTTIKKIVSPLFSK